MRTRNELAALIARVSADSRVLDSIPPAVLEAMGAELLSQKRILESVELNRLGMDLTATFRSATEQLESVGAQFARMGHNVQETMGKFSEAIRGASIDRGILITNESLSDEARRMRDIWSDAMHVVGREDLHRLAQAYVEL